MVDLSKPGSVFGDPDDLGDFWYDHEKRQTFHILDFNRSDPIPSDPNPSDPNLSDLLSDDEENYYVGRGIYLNDAERDEDADGLPNWWETSGCMTPGLLEGSLRRVRGRSRGPMTAPTSSTPTRTTTRCATEPTTRTTTTCPTSWSAAARTPAGRLRRIRRRLSRPRVRSTRTTPACRTASRADARSTGGDRREVGAVRYHRLRGQELSSSSNRCLVSRPAIQRASVVRKSPARHNLQPGGERWPTASTASPR